MSRRNRKRKLEGDKDAESKDYNDALSDEFRDEMATMWEIPQIFHFLHMSKEVLHVSHLSMYEMERMLVMPRASKQLANIMTCLLSPPLPKARARRVPPMPYDFWVNVLAHKVKGWFKVYQSKHRDSVKVLEATGVEPEFWRVFPDAAIADEKDFDGMSFRERIWIVKTLCDTLMHSRKTVHDEVTKQCTEEHREVVLGSDRYGAKYFWFPLFLKSDLRVYRHSIDNKILSTVKPPPWKEGQPSAAKPDKHGRNKRKRSRWKNGALPRDRRRSRKPQEEDAKESLDSRLGSLTNEDTSFSGTSGCSNNNNNNTTIEATERTDSPSLSKTSSDENGATSAATRCRNPKSSGYETNTSSDAKSVSGADGEEMFRGFASSAGNDNDNDADVIRSVRALLDGLTSTVSEMLDDDENSRVRGASSEREDDDDDDEDSRSRTMTLNLRNFDSDREISGARSESGSEDNNAWSEKSQRDIGLFADMLGDLSQSSFELVADSLDSLRDLARGLLNNEAGEGRSRNNAVPRCEITLARTIEELVESLEDVEPMLKESAKKARTKLQREWSNFKNGVVEDAETPGNAERGSNRWILGSQGCPLPPAGETALPTLSDTALSPSDAKIKARRSSGDDPDERTDLGVGSESIEDEKSKKSIKRDERRVKIKIEKEGGDENSDVEGSKEESEPENHRVLRRRGISSYTEQFSSSDEDAYELEEWPRVEAVDPTAGTSDGPSAAHAPAKSGQTGDESDEKDSDQDWILPGSRKRKNKRSLPSRKLKPQQKSQTPDSQLQSAKSPATAEVSAGEKPTKDPDGIEAPPICKMESVHSELDIKDEGPIFDCNRSLASTSLNQSLPHRNASSPSSASQALPRPSLAPQPVVGILTPVQPGYYLQRAQNYYQPPGNPRYVQYPYQVGCPTRYPYSPVSQPYPPQSYVQYQTYGPPTRAPYPNPPLSHAIQRNSVNSPRHQVPSTTLYGARSPMKAAPSRMPAPRSLAPQNSYPAYRGTVVRPRNAANQQPRWYSPRGPATQTSRPTRPAPPKQPSKPTATAAQKTTSLILLSDSDDEIEMIVPEKQNSPVAPQTRKVAPAKPRQANAVAARTRPKPVVTSEITVPKSRQVLSPQMIQRMSQGGISITPVKPQQAKQKGPENSDGTKLVVVVNETGSHYALALPNGSKLILTPEQVAQIRASNGGKLVL